MFQDVHEDFVFNYLKYLILYVYISSELKEGVEVRVVTDEGLVGTCISTGGS